MNQILRIIRRRFPAPVPAIKRRPVEQPKPMSDETKRKLLSVHVRNAGPWRGH